MISRFKCRSVFEPFASPEPIATSQPRSATIAMSSGRCFVRAQVHDHVAHDFRVAPEPRVLFLLLWGVVFFATQALAQRIVSGKVTDDKGTPLQNVSVMAKGTTTGTVTKADGTYSLTVPAGATVLVFSAVDMVSFEAPIGSGSVVDAKLIAEDKTMSEVVVTAFGIKKNKKDLGYGVTQLSGTELSQAHTTNITNALASKIPGVRTQGSGGSFSSSSILIPRVHHLHRF